MTQNISKAIHRQDKAMIIAGQWHYQPNNQSL